jgi:hypothetical protein
VIGAGGTLMRGRVSGEPLRNEAEVLLHGDAPNERARARWRRHPMRRQSVVPSMEMGEVLHGNCGWKAKGRTILRRRSWIRQGRRPEQSRRREEARGGRAAQSQWPVSTRRVCEGGGFFFRSILRWLMLLRYYPCAGSVKKTGEPLVPLDPDQAS